MCTCCACHDDCLTWWVQDFLYPGEDAPAPAAHVWTKQAGRCNYVPPPYDLTACQGNQQTCESQYEASPLGR